MQIKVTKEFDTFQGVSPKDFSKLMEKLQNAIA